MALYKEADHWFIQNAMKQERIYDEERAEGENKSAAEREKALNKLTQYERDLLGLGE